MHVAPDLTTDAVADRAVELERALLARIRGLGSVAVAFSGGVDSSVLLHAAHRALGAQATGVLADSPSLPRRELAEAVAVAREIGAALRIVRTDELADPRYVANAGDRCYHCKSALFDAMRLVAREHDLAHQAFGEITDDLLDERPGARAASERSVVAPLSEAGFSKEDVRAYARRHGLSIAAKPPSACLASRIPVGTRVTRDRLARVERAEEIVRALGFSVLRVRDRLPLARVEVGEDERERADELASNLRDALAPLGFEALEIATYVSPGRA